MDPDRSDARLDALAGQRFRTKFHLRGREAALVQLRGREAIRAHAEDLIAKRLAPALPYKDGKQTPYRGHPSSSPSTRRQPAVGAAWSVRTTFHAAASSIRKSARTWSR